MNALIQCAWTVGNDKFGRKHLPKAAQNKGTEHMWGVYPNVTTVNDTMQYITWQWEGYAAEWDIRSWCWRHGLPMRPCCEIVIDTVTSRCPSWDDLGCCWDIQHPPNICNSWICTNTWSDWHRCGCWGFTSLQHLLSYQDGYRLDAVCTLGDFLVLSHW